MTAAKDLDRVLGELRSLALSERDKGDRFERPMVSFLRVAPQWATKLQRLDVGRLARQQ